MWPRYSAFTDEERREDIDRVLKWRTERRELFCFGVRNVLTGRVPDTVNGARELIEAGQADGRICKYTLSGDVWLARLLGRLGYQFAAGRRSGAVTIKLWEDRMFVAWARVCVRVVPDMDIPLSFLYESFFRWAQSNREHAEEVSRGLGHKKLAAWLRSEGYRSVRRGEGAVFLGINASMPTLKKRPVSEPI